MFATRGQRPLRIGGLVALACFHRYLESTSRASFCFWLLLDYSLNTRRISCIQLHCTEPITQTEYERQDWGNEEKPWLIFRVYIPISTAAVIIASPLSKLGREAAIQSSEHFCQ